MFKLTPTNTRFYDYFDRASNVLVQATQHFYGAMDNLANPQQLAESIKELEHEGDQITHDTMELLHKSFITPIERSEIRRLAIAIDDVIDALEDAARRIVLYELAEMVPAVRSLAGVLVEASKCVRQAVHELRRLRKSRTILEHCIEVHHWEDEGDRIFHDALAWLFKSGMDPLSVVKWKDIFEDLENGIDHCQDVAVVIEGIVLEHA